MKTFAKTKTKLMVLLMALAIVAIVATVVLAVFSRADAPNVNKVASGSELLDVIADINAGKYSSDTVVTLSNDISVDESLNIGSTFTLDLNGKTLAYAGSEVSPVISLSSGTLTIVDNGKGLVTGGTNGGIIVNGGSLALNGGSISGNTSADLGAGVYVAEGSAISVAGSPVISGNTSNGAASNLYLPGDTLVEVGALSRDAVIGVTTDTKRTFTTGYTSSEAGANYMPNVFVADALGATTTILNNEIMTMAEGDVVWVEAKDVAGKAFDNITEAFYEVEDLSDRKAEAILIKLLNNATTNSGLYASTAGLTIDLNGYELHSTFPNSSVLDVSTSNVTRMVFTIMDSRADSEEMHEVVDPISGTTVTIQGGVISGGSYGLTFSDSSARYFEFYFQGGTIAGASKHGIYVAGGNPESLVHIFGGAHIEYNGQFGICSEGCKTYYINNAIINNNGYGGLSFDDATVEITGGEISYNGTTKDTANADVTISKAGIYYVNSTSKLLVDGTTIAGNKAQGIYVKSTASNAQLTLDEANILENASQGVNFVGSVVNIINSNIDGNLNTGITMTATKFTMSGTSVSGNTSIGISINVPNMTVTGSHIDRNGANGITTTTNTTFTMADTSVSGNKSNGLNLSAQATTKVNVSGSTFNDNTNIGFNCLLGVLTIDSSYVEGNGQTGITYTGSTLTAKTTSFRNNGKNYTKSATDQETVNSNLYCSTANKLDISGCTFAGAIGRGMRLNSTAVLDATIDDCSIYGNGGGINMIGIGGTINIRNTSIFDNETLTTTGGAVRLYMNGAAATNVYITKVTMDENVGKGQGGGLYLYLRPTSGSVGLSMTDVSVDDNVASGNGGGAYVDLYPGSGAVTCTMTNVTMDRNSATGIGGGGYIYTYATNGTNVMTLTDVSADDNVATSHSGGLYTYVYSNNSTSTLTINKASIDNNEAKSTASYGAGGMYTYVYSKSGLAIMSMEDVTINKNTTLFTGGGIYCDVISANNGCNLRLKNVEIDGNSANSQWGGARFYLTPTASGDSNVSINNVSVSNNKSTRGYGGLYLYVKNPCKNLVFNADGLHVDNNVADNFIDGNAANTFAGAYIYLYPSAGYFNTDIKNSTFNGNVAPKGSYGGLYLYQVSGLASSQSYMHLDNVEINDNSAGYHYGGAYMYYQASGSSATVDVALKNVTISDNDASTYIENGTYGGAYLGGYSHGVATATLTDVTVSNNTVVKGVGNFGGLNFTHYSSASYSTTTVDGLTANGNTAGANYGGVYLYVYGSTGASTLNMTNVTISDNTARYGNGGGMYVQTASGSSLTANFSHMTISGNTAYRNNTIQSGYGGGLVLYSSATVVSNWTLGEDVTIKNNEAPYGGGLFTQIASSGAGNFTITEGVTISNNTATFEGGGVYVYANSSGKNTTTMTGGSVTSNSAPSGGGVGIYNNTVNKGNSLFKMSGGEITDNRGDAGGGVAVGRNCAIDLSGLINISSNRQLPTTGSSRSNLFLYADNTITISGKLDDKSSIYLNFDMTYSGRVITSGMRTNCPDFDGFTLDKSGASLKHDSSTELTYVPNNDQAPIIIAGTTTTYADFATAWSKVTATQTIQLRADVFMVNTVTLDKNLTIDLNGYVLQPRVGTVLDPMFIVPAGFTLTIKDSTYDNNTASAYPHYLPSGLTGQLVTVYGGVLRGEVEIQGGTLDFKAGNIANGSTTSGYNDGVWLKNIANSTIIMGANASICCNQRYGLFVNTAAIVVDCNISAGSFHDNQYGIYDTATKNALNISGSAQFYNNQYGVWKSGNTRTVSISGNPKFYDNYIGFYKAGNGATTISGGEFCDNLYYGIHYNGTGAGTFTNAKIHGNSNTGMNAYGIYHSNSGALTIGNNVDIYENDIGVGVASSGVFTMNNANAKIHDNNLYGLYVLTSTVGSATAYAANLSAGEIYNNPYGVYAYMGYGSNATYYKFKMTGGTIRNNEIAGIYYGYTSYVSPTTIAPGTGSTTLVMYLSMTGGNVINNDGYGIYLDAYAHYSTASTWMYCYGYFELSAGTITGNKNGGVHLVGANQPSRIYFIGGKAIINSNTRDGKICNLYSEYRYTYHYFTNNLDYQANTVQIYFTGNLSSGSSVGISTTSDPVIWTGTPQYVNLFSGWNATRAGTYLFADDSAQCVSTTNGYLYKGHSATMTKTNQVDPTCTKIGQKEYYTCSQCKQKFTTPEATEFYIDSEQTIPMLEHTYAWKTQNVNTHILTCVNCPATTGEAQAHRITSYKITNETTGAFSGTCGDCNQVVTFTHAASDTGSWQHIVLKGSLMTSSTVHQFTCAICMQDIRSEHVFDGVWLKTYGPDRHYQTCTICGTEAPVPGATHELDGLWIENDKGLHQQTCVACSKIVAVEGAEHDFTGDWLEKEGEQHWKKCQRCGGDYVVTGQPHVYTGAWVDAENGTHHKLKCDICNYEKREQHKYDDVWTSSEVGSKNRPCTVCGYVQTVKCEHPEGTLTKGDETHWWICGLCKDTYNEVAHIYSDKNWQRETLKTHINYCTVCGVYKIEEHVAAGGYDNVNYTKEAHYQICALCDAEMNFEAHQYKWESLMKDDDDWDNIYYYKGICQICDREDMGDFGTGAYHRFQRGDGPEYWTADENEHWRACLDCDERFDIQKHDIGDITTVEGRHSGGICSVCDFGVAVSKHIYGSFKYDPDKPEAGHFRVCTICGERDEADVNGSSHTTPVTFYSNDKHGTWCSVCHYEFKTEKHTLKYVEGVDGHYQACDCGYHTKTVDHVWGRTLNYAAESEQHWQECTLCGAKGNYVDHTPKYLNGGSGGHYVECALCNWKGAEVIEHDFGDYLVSANGHYRSCSFCGYNERTQAHVFPKDEYVDDNYSHWQVCSVCNATSEEEEHLFTGIVNNKNGTHSASCAICGRTDDSTPCDYVLTKTHDDKTHTMICRVCSNETDVAHTYTVDSHNKTQHWKECECGYVADSAKVDHKYGKGIQDGSKHYFECTGCEYVTDPVDHDFANGKYAANDDGHWKLCADCGASDKAVAHKYEEGKGVDNEDSDDFNDGTHRIVCVDCKNTYNVAHEYKFTVGENGKHDEATCKYCTHAAPVEHTYNIPKHDDQDHWMECACGEVDPGEGQKQGHTLWTDATQGETDHYYTCMYCTYVKHEAHSFKKDEYLKENSSATEHWQVCEKCGAEGEHKSHNISKEKTESNNNGTHAALCEDCGRKMTAAPCEYTVKDAKNGKVHTYTCNLCDYSYDEAHYYNLSDADDKQHWNKCECGAVDDSSKVDHMWSDATPAEGGHYMVCSQCDKESELKNHEYEEGKYLYTSVGHRQVCTVCGDISAFVDHVINGAKSNGNGTHSAACDVCEFTQSAVRCSYEYKRDNAETHKGTCTVCGDTVDQEHRFNTLKQSATQHWYVCDVCSEQDAATKAPHNWSEAIQAEGGHYYHCEDDFCGYDSDVQSHVMSKDAWKENDEGHWQICSECGVETAPRAHSYGNTSSKNDDVHAATCSVCGRSDEEAHTFVYGQNALQHTTMCAKCDYSKSESHNYDEYTYDADNHWKECDFCGYVDKATEGKHTYGEDNYGAVCDTCGKPSSDVLGTVRRNAINRLDAFYEGVDLEALSAVNKLRVNDALRTAKNTINSAETAQEIAEAEKDCKAAINGIILDNQKGVALTELTTMAEKARVQFMTSYPDMSEDDLAVYETAISDALTLAQNSIYDALSLDEINSVLKANASTFGAVILATHKASALTEIRAQAASYKEQIGALEGEVEVARLQALIDAELERAEKNIESARTTFGVDDVIVRYVAIFAEILADYENPDLAEGKSEGREDLDNTAEEKKEELQQEADDKKDEIQEEADKEKGEIDDQAKKDKEAAEAEAEKKKQEVEEDEDLDDDEKQAKKDEIDQELEAKKEEIDKKAEEDKKDVQDQADKDKQAEQDRVDGLKDEIDQATKDAEDDINNAESEEDVKDKVEQGQGNIGEAADELSDVRKEVKSEAEQQAQELVDEKLNDGDRYSDDVQKALDDYLKAVDEAKRQEDLDAAEKKFQDALDAIEAKDEANAELEQEAQKAKDALPKDWTDEERKPFEDAIDQALENAKKDVDSAKTADDVSEKKEEANSDLEDSLFDTSKDVAQEVIEKDAQAKKDEIEANDELTDEQKAALKDIIEKEAERAQERIEKAETPDDIEKEQDRSNGILDDIVENPQLAQDKDTARKDLETEAESKKDDIQTKAEQEKQEIEDRVGKDGEDGLTREEADALKEQVQKEADAKKEEVDKALEEARDNVTQAESKEDIDKKVEEGKGGIDEADTLADAKLAAQGVVQDQAAIAKGEISGPTAEARKADVDKALAEYLSKISNAKNGAEVEQIQQEFTTAISAIKSLASAQTYALSELDNAATAAKNALPANLADRDKYVAAIDAALANAKKAVENATTAAAAESALASGKSAITAAGTVDGDDRPDPPVDPLQQAKNSAKDTIDAKAIAAINGLFGPQKSTYSAQINAALESYIAQINSAETVEDIEALQAAFLAEITALVKTDAIEGLEKNAEDEINSLPDDMDETEKGKYQDAIQKELDKAKGEVQNSETVEDVAGKVEQADSDMDKAIVDTAKDIATDKVEKDAQAKKDAVDANPELSAEQKRELKEIIEKEAERAEKKIEEATSREGAETEQKRGEEVTSDVVSNPELAASKSAGRDDLEAAAKAKKDEIDEKVANGEITAEKGEELKKAVDESTKAAEDKVTEAQTADDVQKQIDEGKKEIEESGTEPTEPSFLDNILNFFKTADMPLDYAVIALGAMLVLIIILAIAARKPKKR